MFYSVLVGVVAQLVEHHNGIVGVIGSNPFGSTIQNKARNLFAGFLFIKGGVHHGRNICGMSQSQLSPGVNPRETTSCDCSRSRAFTENAKGRANKYSLTGKGRYGLSSLSDIFSSRT